MIYIEYKLNENNAITLAFSLPSHPRCPISSSISRGNVQSSGWLFHKLDDNSTQCTYLVWPGVNSFPTWIVNMISTKQPMLIQAVREYFNTVEMSGYKFEQNNHHNSNSNSSTPTLITPSIYSNNTSVNNSVSGTNIRLSSSVMSSSPLSSSTHAHTSNSKKTSTPMYVGSMPNHMK